MRGRARPKQVDRCVHPAIPMRQAERSAGIPHFITLRFFVLVFFFRDFRLFLKISSEFLEIRGFYVLLAKKLCFKYGTWQIPLYPLGKRSDLQLHGTVVGCDSLYFIYFLFSFVFPGFLLVGETRIFISRNRRRVQGRYT